MKIGIYDPYLHILGGAERYVLSIAACFGKEADICFYSSDPQILKRAEEKFDIKLSNAHIVGWPESSWVRESKLKELDYFFYVTDGSIFRSPAKKSILLIQTPVHIPPNSFVNWWKFRSWDLNICYSKFMSQIIEKRLRKKAHALFVPIKKIVPEDFTKKENIILSVGRFFPHLHNKKQLEMVEIFAKLIDAGVKNVKLYLVGSVDPGGEEYFEKVKLKARNMPVWVESQMSHSLLTDLYKKAKIYWHATGLGEDLKAHPERAEHFGVSTVEAMSHGAVPVVFHGGGQMEIVTSGTNGFTWRTEAELIKYTKELLANKYMQEKMAHSAFSSSLHYTEEIFCETLHEILESK